MNKRSRSVLFAAVVGLVPVVLSGTAMGQSPLLYTGGTYTQNFDGLPNSGGSSTFTGANAYYLSEFFPSAGVDGWQVSRNGVEGPVLFGVSTGSLTSGSVYSYGESGNTDRALGSIGSNSNPGAVGSAKWYYGLVLVNNTTNTYTDFNLAYNGEQWRNGGNTVAHSLVFDYAVSSDPINLASTGFNLNSSLNFTSPVTGATAAVVNGNAEGRVSNINATVAAINWVPNSYLVLRWADLNDANSDHALAIDDVSFEAFASGFEAKSVTWTGAVSNAWNTTESNWAGEASVYSEASSGLIGDNVTFDGQGAGVIQIDANGVAPRTIKVEGSSDYTFQGGAIRGAGIADGFITKTGSGTLTFASSNAFTGRVNLNEGRIIVSDANGLGTGNVLAGNDSAFQFSEAAVLEFTTASAFSLQTLSLRPNSVTEVRVAAGTTVTAGTGTAGTNNNADQSVLRKTGTGTLTYTGEAVQDAILSVRGGALVINQTSNPRFYGIDGDWGSATEGDFVVGGPVAVRFRPSILGNTIGAPGTTGKLVLSVGFNRGQSQFPSFQAGNNGGVIEVNNQIVLLGQTTAEYGVGAGVGSAIRVNGGITGTGDLYFGTGFVSPGGGTNYVSGGTGLVELNSTSTYSGKSVVALQSGGVVRIGVDNALPIGTQLQFADTNMPAVSTNGSNSYSVGAIDLNGRTLSVGSVTLATTSGLPVDGIINSQSSAATLVLTGSSTATYAGPIGRIDTASGGSTNINIATGSGFSGTQTFSGTLQQSGTLSVGSGKVVLASDLLNSGAMTVTGGVLQISPVDRAGGASPRLIVANTVSITGSGFVDIGNSNLVVRSGDIVGLTAAAATWWNNGTRDGSGLGSTLTAGTVATVGVAQNINTTGGVLLSDLGGVSLSTTDVLVKYTYLGDTDFNGLVDSNDLANLIAGLRSGGSLSGWLYGDTNYDGVVDANDMANLLKAMRLQGAPLTNPTGVSTGGAVPEPAALGLLLAAVPMMGRRRRA